MDPEMCKQHELLKQYQKQISFNYENFANATEDSILDEPAIGQQFLKLPNHEDANQQTQINTLGIAKSAARCILTET